MRVPLTLSVFCAVSPVIIILDVLSVVGHESCEVSAVINYNPVFERDVFSGQ